MSNEIAIAGQSMLEELGMANLAKPSGVYVPRISMIQEGIMGTMDVNGKQVKTEVVPAGAYKVSPEKDVVVYAESISVRIFTMRQQFTYYDAQERRVYKTVQSMDTRGELKDERGGFNLGRPGGYIQDYKSLTPEQKAVKTAKIVYGVANLHNVTNENGEPVDGYTDPMPFVMDITSTNSKKALDAALAIVVRKQVLPFNYQLNLAAKGFDGPNGRVFQSIAVTGADPVEPDDRDQDTLAMFKDRIEGFNKYILSKWDEANSNDPQMSDDDIDLVHAFVDVEEAD
jgi:hypothetical protein